VDNRPIKLVTLGGECFDSAFQRESVATDRDGVFYLFKLTDLVKNRGERLVSVYRPGPGLFYGADYDMRISTVLLNVLRRAIDSGFVSFDLPCEAHKYQELVLNSADFRPRPAVRDQELRQFIIHKAFWLAFRHSPAGSRWPVPFDEPIELEYLGVSSEDVKRNMRLLGEQGLLEKTNVPGLGRPTAKLVEIYEAKQSTTLPNERLFPKGTQYEAFKKVTAILRLANREIFIADNYLNDEVLDMLLAVPTQPKLRLLTFRPAADFKVAVKRFQSQYQRAVEAKTHNAEIHDRAIVVDDTHFYALGGSVKDMGAKLTFLNKVEDATNMNKLRTELERIWASAVPLS